MVPLPKIFAPNDNSNFKIQPMGLLPELKGKLILLPTLKRWPIKTHKSHSIWPNTLRYLKLFSGGTLPFSIITEQWLENFKQYLLGQVSPNSANKYFGMI
ncbi:phage integrase SAM-like domain-containing protein [bacterium]|nr:phage integrase SAM-like domain-containing protein [bacterium]